MSGDDVMNLSIWAARWWHTLPPEAQQEFQQIHQPHSFVRPDANGKSESAVQAEIKLAAAKEYRAPLWRNNSGASQMVNPDRPNEKPRFVRFGLGNESAKVNKSWKSSDLIGITPVNVTAAHVGKVLGVFTAVEVKEPGWSLKPSDTRAQAQANFMNNVHTFGGFAGFAQSTDDLHRIIANGRPQGEGFNG